MEPLFLNQMCFVAKISYPSQMFGGNIFINTRSQRWKCKKQPSPGTSRHLHASVKGRFALKVIHDDAVVTIDDMLVDALPTKMLKDFVDAINAVQNSLKGHKRKKSNEYETYQILITMFSS